MHIVVAFLIFAGLAAGFVSEHIVPDNEYLVNAGNKQKLRLRAEISPLSELLFNNVMKQRHDYSCGSAALATLLNESLGENLTEKLLIRGMLMHGDIEQIKKLRAFSLYDMQRICNVLGYDAQGYKAKIEELENPEYWPAIIPIILYGYRHFVVFKGVYDNRVFVADPFRGNSSYLLTRFQELWYDNIIFIVTNGPSKKKKLDALKISAQDLRYITEDYTKDLSTHPIEPFQLPPEFTTMDIPGEWQLARPPYH